MQELPPRTPIPFKRLSDNTCGEVTVPSNSKWCFLYNCTVASEPFFFSIFTKEPQAATKTDKTNKQKKKSASVFSLQIHPAVMRPILNKKKKNGNAVEQITLKEKKP